MSDIESLTSRAKELNHALDWWNIAMVWALVFAAIAAVGVVVTTRLALLRAKQVGDAQAQLLKAKDDELTSDLREKDLKIAEAGRKAAEAAERAENERAARLRLQAQLVARRLTGEQKHALAQLLRPHPGAVAIVSTITDGEGSDFADDFEAAIKAANWATVRIKNDISSRYGILLGTVAGTTLPGTTQIGTALTAIGVTYEHATFNADDHSISPWFQAGVIYLVIEHRPEPKAVEP